MADLQAYGPFVAIRREPKPSTSPILLPETASGYENRGRVLSVGAKVEGLTAGDIVTYIGLAFDVEGLLIVKAENIIAVEPAVGGNA